MTEASGTDFSRDLSALTWRKSKHSGANGECVEVARLRNGHIAVRHSKTPEGPTLIYTPAEISAFLSGVKDGEFDYLVA